MVYPRVRHQTISSHFLDRGKRKDPEENCLLHLKPNLRVVIVILLGDLTPATPVRLGKVK